MVRILLIFISFLLVEISTFEQLYGSIKIKEDFDTYNAMIVNNYNPCGISPTGDGDSFGDGMSFILDGYITMYRTTGDKAYLFKFIIQSLCIMENRHDFAGLNSEARWTDATYQNGYIIGPFCIKIVKLLRTSIGDYLVNTNPILLERK